MFGEKESISLAVGVNKFKDYRGNLLLRGLRKWSGLGICLHQMRNRNSIRRVLRRIVRELWRVGMVL